MKEPAIVNVKVASGAVLPTQAYDEGDIASDIYTLEDALVVPGALKIPIIKTGLSTEFDSVKYGLFISPRSSITKLPISLANATGLIEGTYRGDIGITLRNELHHDFRMWSPFAIMYDEETKSLVRKSVSDIPTGLLEKAKEQYFSEFELLFDYDIPEDFRESLFVTEVPHGTVFIPKQTRLVQAYLVEKVNMKWVKTDELSETKRGTGGFGSSGSGKA